MTDKRFSWPSFSSDPQETFFRLIQPDEYVHYGINPRDVPMGTYAAEDHPGFLPSRFGGNAYGLGLMEQSVLSRADTDFLEGLDFDNINEVIRNVGRLNAIYQKLGLLIRFSATGKRYFLIPINLVAHSLQEIKSKGDEIEELIIQHIFETRRERLDIGVLTDRQDLLVHELTARLSSHRIIIFDSIDKLRSWRLPLDIVILPKDPFEYLLEQSLPRAARRPMNKQRLLHFAVYLAGKIYDLLERDGKLHVLAHSPGPQEDRHVRVRFKSEEDIKLFLLFTHTFRTRKRYEATTGEEPLDVHVADFHYYLNRFAFSEPHLKGLLDDHKPEELTLKEVDQLPYLNVRMPQTFMKNPDREWRGVFETYFHVRTLKQKSPRHHHQYWEERLEIDGELPESLFVFIGQPRTPSVDLLTMEDEVKASGMQGCSLSLVAEYRNSFRYVLDVLKILVQIRDHRFPRLSELERTRLCNPFHGRNETSRAVTRLLGQIRKLEQCQDILNPDGIEGHVTPILEHILKLSLHGLSPLQLREILLIVVGHTTMSRIVFGKLPVKTLQAITDGTRHGEPQSILSTLRLCRLMSFAEMAASLGDEFTEAQARELFRLYDDAAAVATDAQLTWERLRDLRISAIGGVQNMAIREMMKFFNLFEFLDDWQEFLDKGACEKDVICDYSPERLARLEEGQELARIAERFKHDFLGDSILGQSTFFRQFLEAEFHGTGHLFPHLGVRAGFLLVWIAVNASQRLTINFNPVLAGTSPDRRETRQSKIRDVLLRLPHEALSPSFFEEVKRTLAEGRPAFIFDSGFRIMINPQTRATDISFVDVDENIQQIESLLSHFESQKLSGISLKNLVEMERRFSELESFHQYLHREGCFLQCSLLETPGGVEEKDRIISRIEGRLKSILRSQIFIPEEIHDTLFVLQKHCPEIMRFILPEFHALSGTVEVRPGALPQSLGCKAMRSLEKFQALIVKDRNAFQDRNVFYQLAKQEFGPLAEEGIGATHAQMEILEYLVDRVQQHPPIYQALTLALLFQEVGKVENLAAGLLEPVPLWTPAEQGALVLEKTDILEKYELDPQVEGLLILLVRHHGMVGRVVCGEEPATALKRLTELEDERLLDVFVLHSVLAMAAEQEGVMVSELLDEFLLWRSVSLQIIRSRGDWTAWLRDSLREKGETVLPEFHFTAPGDTKATQLELCGFDDPDVADEALWRGRQSAAFERLLKLMGISWVDFQDVQMYLLKMPVNFIYHKKKLKSAGLATFESQLEAAEKLYNILSALSPDVRFYILYCLDALGGALRITGFNPLPTLLAPEECLKLMLISFQAFHHYFGAGERGGLISFQTLSRNIERRHEVVQKALCDLPFPHRCQEEWLPPFLPNGYGELRFHASPVEKAVRADFFDSVQFDAMVRSLVDLWDHETLAARYETLIREIQEKLPYDTLSFREELERAFEEQQKRINDRLLRSVGEALSGMTDFAGLQEIRDGLGRKGSPLHFTEEQVFLLNEMFEFHQARVRDLYLEAITRDIGGMRTRESLLEYWDRLKFELLSYRSFVGKEYESFIARLVDDKLRNLEAGKRE